MLTVGRTDGRTDGQTEIWTPISHPARSRCDKNVQKFMFLKTPKFGMQQKARIFFFSGLPNLNLFHILTQDTESNHLKQKTKN